MTYRKAQDVSLVFIKSENEDLKPDKNRVGKIKLGSTVDELNS